MTPVQPFVAEKDPILDSPTEIPTWTTEGVYGMYMVGGHVSCPISTFYPFCFVVRVRLCFMQCLKLPVTLPCVRANPGYNLVYSMSMGSSILHSPKFAATL
ncbi:hypothetical protein BO99DRAFT_399377 [Aspergillus violaceofuscus CBS 115571]|uniref:Uncharacterized protein n=1 Tax=Aspergillus violaceofuscus (strain CBS 115571) TaxID=1450538 RepID=A0A2V5HKI1_ASPV1|nr:hypothetical protein BO99DRAFT_399377 [Aspergillus violaceofuscus CBS 115571]